MTVAYEDIHAINFSSLKHMAVSPLEYKFRLDHPEEDKDAFAIGGAGHCMIFEPSKFDERFAVFDGTRNEKHEKWQAWKKEHPGIRALKPHELAHVQAVAKAVRADRVAEKQLRGGRAEEIVTWNDEVTGLACKGRLDYIRPDVVIDLKTTHDPRPQKFERAAHDYNYAAQLAFYHDGAIRARLIDGRSRPLIIAAQTVDPYHVVVFRLKPETLEIGRALYRSWLHRLVECTDAGWWPGIAEDIVDLGVPPWAEKQLFSQPNEDF